MAKHGKSGEQMSRRQFLGKSTAAVAAASFGGSLSASAQSTSSGNKSFNLKYAPHFGMFKKSAGDDLVDQLKFMADQGFRALEDNGMMGRDVAVQEQIAKEMSRLKMEMGVFVAYAEFGATTFVLNETNIREMLVQRMQKAVETAKRVNATWTTIVPGKFSTHLEWDYQTSNVIENLKWCADVCEKAGLIMVLEPLNAWRDHPGLFLTKIPQAYLICKAVDSPSCKILNDLYHQQITEGNLIPNIDTAWDEIAYFQVGDNPGRKEPTTGEINYYNVFKHIHAKGFQGIVGMEHGNSMPGKDGEMAVIEAYRKSDAF